MMRDICGERACSLVGSLVNKKVFRGEFFLGLYFFFHALRLVLDEFFLF